MRPHARPATLVALACFAFLPGSAAAQNTSPDELSRILEDYVVAACRNAAARGNPGLQAGSCTQLIDSGKLGPKALVDAHFLRGYALEAMARKEEVKYRWIDLPGGTVRRATPEEIEKASNGRTARNRDRAIADYAKAIDLDPKMAWSHFDKGVRGDVNQWAQGEAPWPSFFFGRGMAAMRIGRGEEGKSDIARAAQLDPQISEKFARHGINP